MKRQQPRRLLAIAAGLVIAGWLVPFLMVLKVVEPSFALSFLSYAALVSGLGLGLVGAVQYVSARDEDDG